MNGNNGKYGLLAGFSRTILWKMKRELDINPAAKVTHISKSRLVVYSRPLDN
jgi:hypothetical protein